MFEPTPTAPAPRVAARELIAPVSGRLLPLEEVPDLLYSERRLGPGIAVEPGDGLFASPLTGTVRTCPGTHHAFYLDAPDGTQVLVHIGVDAHLLRGLGFLPLVSEGQAVQAGQSLCLVDLEYLRIAALPTVSALVLTRRGEGAEFVEPRGQAVRGRTRLGRLAA